MDFLFLFTYNVQSGITLPKTSCTSTRTDKKYALSPGLSFLSPLICLA